MLGRVSIAPRRPGRFGAHGRGPGVVHHRRIAVMPLVVQLQPVQPGDARGDGADARGQDGAQVRVDAPGRAHELAAFRNDVEGLPAAHAAHRYHRRPGLVQLPGAEAVHGQDEFGQGGDGVRGGVGLGAVPAGADEGALEAVRGGHHRAGHEPGLARPQFAGQGAHVAAEDGRDPLQHPGLDERPGAEAALLPGLEHQPGPERQPPRGRLLRQQAGRAQQAGGMGVVAAGVHPPGELGSEGQAGQFRHRQGVHVGADGHPRAAVAQVRPHAGTGPHRRQTQAAQGRLHHGGGLGQVQADLRNGVERPAPLDDPGQGGPHARFRENQGSAHGSFHYAPDLSYLAIFDDVNVMHRF
jgi:hypothetical protein